MSTRILFASALLASACSFLPRANAVDGITVDTMGTITATGQSWDGHPVTDTDVFYGSSSVSAMTMPAAWASGETAPAPGVYQSLAFNLSAGAQHGTYPIDSGTSGAVGNLSFSSNVPLQYTVTYNLYASAHFLYTYLEELDDSIAAEGTAYATGFFGGQGSVSASAMASRHGAITEDTDTFYRTYVGTSPGGNYSLGVETQFAYNSNDVTGPWQGEFGNASAAVNAAVTVLPTTGLRLMPGTSYQLNVAGGTSAIVSNTAAPAAFSVINLGSTAKLDVANGNVVTNVDGANPVALSDVRAKLASGFNGGNWAGYGIISSAAAANPAYRVGYARAGDIGVSWFNNLTVPADAVIIDYCLIGDLNLDGMVGFDDMLKLTQFYNVNVSGRVWSQGDVNYDGYVNYDDLLALNQNLYQSGLQDAIDTGLFTGEVLAALQRAAGQVPEPLAACVICAAITTTRRRRVI